MAEYTREPSYKNKDLLWILNVLRYPSFVQNIDMMNNFYVERGEINEMWRQLIILKYVEYDSGWLARRWPGKEQHYLDYVVQRGLLQKFSKDAVTVWEAKAKKWDKSYEAPTPIEDMHMYAFEGKTWSAEKFFWRLINELDSTTEAREEDEANRLRFEEEALRAKEVTNGSRERGEEADGGDEEMEDDFEKGEDDEGEDDEGHDDEKPSGWVAQLTVRGA